MNTGDVVTMTVNREGKIMDIKLHLPKKNTKEKNNQKFS